MRFLRRFVITSVLLAETAVFAHAQNLSQRHWSEIGKTLSPGGHLRIINYATGDLPPCNSNEFGVPAYNVTLNKLGYCDGTNWVYDFIDWPLLAPDGSVTAPSYSFANAVSGGVYLHPGQFVAIKGKDGSGVDAIGLDVMVVGGASTGTAVGGVVTLIVSPPGATSGASLNTYQNAATFSGTALTIGGLFVGSGAAGQATYQAIEPATGRTDVAGGTVRLRPGRGTGLGVGGDLIEEIATPGSLTGSTHNAYQTALTVSGTNGSFGFGGIDVFGTPSASTWAGADRAAGVTDGAGGGLTVRSGQGTGAAAATSIAFQTPTVGASGTAQQSLATRLTIATTDLTATVPFLAPNGSASAPTYAFSSSTTTGWNSSGSGIIHFSSAGSNVFSILSGGETYLLRGIEANTAGSGAPNVLTTPDESFKVLTNEGATAENYHTLPAAVAAGDDPTYTFIVQDADGLRVTAGTGDTIRIGGVVSTSGGFCNSTTIGSSLTLVSINVTEWMAISSVGTWACS